MSKEENKTDHIDFRCPKDLEAAISRIAVDQRKTRSEVIRQLVDAGLVATGYKQDEDHLAQLVQTAVQTAMKPQVERLASISAKAAQISGAAFFLNVFTARLMLPPSEQQLAEEAAGRARKLGIEYLKLKDRDMDAFIEGGVEKIIGN